MLGVCGDGAVVKSKSYRKREERGTEGEALRIKLRDATYIRYRTYIELQGQKLEVPLVQKNPMFSVFIWKRET